MSLFKRFFGKDEPESQGFVQVDFDKTFPQVFWTSNWGKDADFPDEFRYKVFSVRCEPAKEFEVVLVQELRDGTNTEMQRWSVPPDQFGASDEIIQMLEEQFGVSFEKVDMSEVRTFEEFEARCREAGWDVSS